MFFSNAANECNVYKNLSEADRNVKAPYQPVTVKCDKKTLTDGWYRFTGSAGNKMPTTCIPSNKCGTHASGWLNGTNPTNQDGAVSRTVCFHWSKKCCNWNTVIQVRNCGAYFVYKLVKPTACHLRYCGIDWCVLQDGLAVVLNRLEGNISLLWFISPANQHPISTIKKKSPHTFAHLGNFSKNESATFDNHKILLFWL